MEIGVFCLLVKVGLSNGFMKGYILKMKIIIFRKVKYSF